MKAASLLPTLLFCLSPFTLLAQTAAPEYRALKLNRGVEIDVPKDWTAVNGPEKKEPVATVKAELFNEPPSAGKVLFEAYDLARKGPARVMVEAIPAVMPPERIAALTEVELSGISERLQQGLAKSESLKVSPLQKIKIGDCWGTEHLELMEINGYKVIVRHLHMTTGKNVLHFWLSYPEGDPDYWKPIMAHIRESLKVPMEK